MQDVREMVIGAYNKFKSRIFYNSGVHGYKKRIMEFESCDFDKKIELLTFELTQLIKSQKISAFFEDLINQVDYIPIMKKTDLKSKESDLNYFIDLPVELHIIDAMWTNYTALWIDESYNDYQYGNQLDVASCTNNDQFYGKTLNWDTNTMFKKYIFGYNKWIEKGVKTIRRERNIVNKMTLHSFDLTRFYYRVNNPFELVYEALKMSRSDTFTILSKIMEQVFQKYRVVLFSITSIELGNLPLPIGLSSSMVISNLFMLEFDNYILAKENTVYYGRYVDDFIYITTDELDEKEMIESLTSYFKSRTHYKQLKFNATKSRSFTIEQPTFLTDLELLLRYLSEKENQYYEGGDNEEISYKRFINLDKKVLNGNLLSTSLKNEGDLLNLELKSILLFMNYIFRTTNFEDETLNDIMDKITQSITPNLPIGHWREIFFWISCFAAKRFIGNKNMSDIVYTLFESLIDEISHYNIKDIKEHKSEDVHFKLQNTYQTILKVSYNLGTYNSSAKINEGYSGSGIKKPLNLLSPLIDMIKNNKIIKSHVQPKKIKNELKKSGGFTHFGDLTTFNQIVAIILDTSYSTKKTIKQFSEVYGTDNKIVSSNTSLSNKYKSVEYSIASNGVFEEKFIVSQPNVNLDDSMKGLMVKDRNIVVLKPLFRETLKFMNMLSECVINKSTLLLLPEVYIKLDWLHILSYFSYTWQVVCIGGLELFSYKGKMLNISLSFYPYRDRLFRRGYLSLLRGKNNYSYYEKKFCQESGLVCKDIEIPIYQCVELLGIRYTDYLCFEVTDIIARGLFRGKVDLVAIPMMNRDTKYFDNILQSLARDLSAIVISTNSADWGNSSIILPKRTNQKIKTEFRGGFNNYLVSSIIPIRELKQFNALFDKDSINNSNDFKKHSAGFVDDTKQNYPF